VPNGAKVNLKQNNGLCSFTLERYFCINFIIDTAAKSVANGNMPNNTIVSF